LGGRSLDVFLNPPFFLSTPQVLVPPGYGEDVKAWPAALIHPSEPVKESPKVLKVDSIIIHKRR